MANITPKQLISIQKGLRRGTEVQIREETSGDKSTVRFDGFSDIECPYKFCELHPRKHGKKPDNPCQGFMLWYSEEDKEKTYNSCPMLGGFEMTVGQGIFVEKIYLKEKVPGSDEVTISEVIPSKF